MAVQHTLAQKILQAHTDTEIRGVGQFVRCPVSMVLANDITGPLALQAFEAMGAERVFDKDRIALVMDHFTPQKDIDAANQVKYVRGFARKMGITHYYEGGDCGVEHTLLPEQGLVGPGDIVVGADSHTCTYGGIAAFSTGFGSTDVAAAMALGDTWFKVPASIRVTFTGALPEYCLGKDLILWTIGAIGVDGALYCSLEFDGAAIAALSVESRLSMANMAVEAGAKTGLFAADEKTLAYTAAAGRKDAAIAADPGAEYLQELCFDVTGMQPLVACPHLPSKVKPAEELKNLPVDQVVIGSCTNGRIEDLRAAAAVLKGRRVAKDVRCIVLPSTPTVWKRALAEGLIATFMDAGCVVGPATCGPCLGGHMGILGDGERAIATTNRNFKGRMGSLKSEVYLSNPFVAAASAVTGEITSPTAL